MRRVLTVGLVVAAAAFAADAGAFCGFYVSGADAKLFNNATQVVLMRDGTRTVLSMQNNYQGPPQDFAMVVPVPVVLQKENVKTLAARGLRPRRPARRAAPRRVLGAGSRVPGRCARRARGRRAAPCAWRGRRRPRADGRRRSAAAGEDRGAVHRRRVRDRHPERDGLDRRSTPGCAQNGYKIPDGAEPYLRPYVAEGMKFFVAKVDSRR